jgi:integrase
MQFDNQADELITEVKKIFALGDYIAVFGWLQWVLRQSNCPYNLSRQIDAALRVSRAAYRVLEERTIVPIGSDAELETLKRAFADLAATEFHGARAHLRNAAQYLDSQKFFTSKSAGTQRMRRGILERFRAAYGDRPFALLLPEWIEVQLDAKPPHAARSWLVTLRSLCQFAVKRGLLRVDPTANIKLASAKSDGFHCWTDAEIAQFEAHHPIGTKPRLALALLFYTAQRRSDVVRMGRQHVRETPEGPALYVKQRKTGVELLIPIPELRTVLDATPSEHLTFLVTATGKPYGDNHFSESFREWCDVAGLPKRCSAHGLRKARCRWLAEHECNGLEIMAISGHVTMKELVRYTRAADQARLARNALRRTTKEEASEHFSRRAR